MHDACKRCEEGIFEADAGLMSINDDGTFQDRGFHQGPRSPLTLYLHTLIRTFKPFRRVPICAKVFAKYKGVRPPSGASLITPRIDLTRIFFPAALFPAVL